MNTAARRSLLVLTQYYEPETGFITKDVATRLAEHGRVVVITAVPNFPQGRVFDGWKSWRPQKRIEDGGVEVWRVPIVADHSRSKFRRMLSYLSFTVSAALLAPLVIRRPSSVWVYHTPFTTAIAALWFRLIGSRVVYTVADLWPESMLAAGLLRPGLVERILHGYSRLINRAAHLIVCSTLGTLERFASDGTSRAALRYVPVWLGGIAESHQRSPAPVPPCVVYAGNIGPLQGLDVVVRAAALLEGRGTPIKIILYGSGSEVEPLKQLATNLRVTTVAFAGRVTPAQAFALSAEATAQIVCLRSTPLLDRTLPSKLAFALAAGSPILAGLHGEAAAVATASGGALLFDSDQPEDLAETMLFATTLTADDRHQRALALRGYYHENFARETLLEMYVGMLYPELT